jgi:hypothetical protein
MAKPSGYSQTYFTNRRAKAKQSFLTNSAPFGERAEDNPDGWAAHHFPGIRSDTVNEAQQAAVKYYVGPGYLRVNNTLRGLPILIPPAQVERVKTVTSELTSLINRSRVPVETVVERGVYYDFADGLRQHIADGTFKVGSTLHDEGFTSSSLALPDSYKNARLKFKITLPPGSAALPVNNLGRNDYSAEKELLIQRGTTYTVTKIEQLADPDGSNQRSVVYMTAKTP